MGAARDSGRQPSAERLPVAPDDHCPADVGFLLERGTSVDAKGVFGGAGLHGAALNRHAETVEFLASRGAGLAIRDVRFYGKRVRPQSGSPEPS